MTVRILGVVGLIAFIALAPAHAQQSSPISQLPSDALPVASHLSKADVYDSSNAKVGLIEDVLVGQDGKVVAYILNVGEWYGGLGKYIAVPFPSHGDQEEGRQHVGRSFHDEGRRAERAAAEV
jgi:PRC-barrel domain